MKGSGGDVKTNTTFEEKRWNRKRERERGGNEVQGEKG